MRVIETPPTNPLRRCFYLPTRSCFYRLWFEVCERRAVIGMYRLERLRTAKTQLLVERPRLFGAQSAPNASSSLLPSLWGSLPTNTSRFNKRVYNELIIDSQKEHA